MSLLDVVKNVLPIPLSSFGESAVNAYAALPWMKDWTPPAGLQPMDAHRIVAFGWAFAVIGPNLSLEHVVSKAKNGHLDQSDWSVIQAGALLTRLGARVEFLKEKKNARTADIRAWWGQAPVDAEVKTAKVKDRQIELRDIMNTLAQVIGMRSTPWHPLIHLGEVPIADVQAQILDVVLELDAGKRAGTADAWEVYAVPLDQEGALVDNARLTELRPTWWKDDGPSLTNQGLSMSSNPNDVRRIQISAKLPFLSYLNQIREKADIPQGDPNNPFLVVLDQGAMPLRHGKLQSEIQPWLQQWQHVSGILCFDQRPFMYSKFCWKLSFHMNPSATLALPAAALSLLPPPEGEIFDEPFCPFAG